MFEINLRLSILKNLAELDGIGKTQINAIESFFSNKINTKISKNLIKELNISDYSIKNLSGKFSNKKKSCLPVAFKT